MTLGTDIQNTLAGFKGNAPPEIFQQIEAAIARLEAARIGADAPTPGTAVPETQLLSLSGAPVALQQLYSDHPLVLIFYRGRWCPFCNLTLRAYNSLVHDFEAAGARLVAVSPQTLEEAAATHAERGLEFELVTDPHNTAARAFGLAWSLTAEDRALYTAFGVNLEIVNGDDRWELPAPATFIIDRTGIVRWSSVDPNYTQRAEPAEVLDALKSVFVAYRQPAA
jgi:peroxiredoxin